MTQRRQPTPEDLAAFRAAVDGAVPLRVPERVAFEPPKPSPRPRQRELDEAAAVTESLYGPFEIDDLLAIGDADSYLRTGLPRNVLRDLRRGRWSIQNHTDLHGLNRHAVSYTHLDVYKRQHGKYLHVGNPVVVAAPR